MSENGALVRPSMIGAPHGTARRRRVAFGAPATIALASPFSVGLAVLVLAVGTSSFYSRRLTVAQKSSTGC